MKKDKVLHLIAGFAISLLFGTINPFLGLAVAIIAGAAKEIVWDLYLGKGNCEAMDFVWTLIGGLMGFAIMYLI